MGAVGKPEVGKRTANVPLYSRTAIISDFFLFLFFSKWRLSKILVLCLGTRIKRQRDASPPWPISRGLPVNLARHDGDHIRSEKSLFFFSCVFGPSPGLYRQHYSGDLLPIFCLISPTHHPRKQPKDGRWRDEQVWTCEDYTRYSDSQFTAMLMQRGSNVKFCGCYRVSCCTIAFRKISSVFWLNKFALFPFWPCIHDVNAWKLAHSVLNIINSTRHTAL